MSLRDEQSDMSIPLPGRVELSEFAEFLSLPGYNQLLMASSMLFPVARILPDGVTIASFPES